MSAADKRAHIAMLQCLGWTIGVTLMPLVAWATRDWVTFIIITSAPCAVFFLAYKLVTSQNIIWVIKLRRMSLERCTQGLVGRPEGKRPLARPRRRWEESIKMDSQEVVWGYGLDLSGPGQGQVAGALNAVMNFLVS